MNNLAITIDEQNRKVKLLFRKDKALTYKQYDFGEDCINDTTIDYQKVFALTLDQFILEQGVYPATAVFVLSDKCAVCHHIEVPSFLQKKQDVLLSEISSSFKQSQLFKTTFVPIGSHGAKSQFSAIMVRNSSISSVLTALKPYKFFSRAVTFEGAATASAYLALKNSRKKDTALFINIKKYRSELVAIKDNNLIAFTSIPCGEDCNQADLASCVYEMRDNLLAKYDLGGFMLKYNSNAYSCKGIDKISVEDTIVKENLDLYGALYPTLYHKGLIF